MRSAPAHRYAAGKTLGPGAARDIGPLFARHAVEHSTWGEVKRAPSSMPPWAADRTRDAQSTIDES